MVSAKCVSMKNLIFAVDSIPTSQLSHQMKTKPEIPLKDLERCDLKRHKKETETSMSIDILIQLPCCPDF